MKKNNKIRFFIRFLTLSLFMALGFNLSNIKAETISLIPGREISLSSFSKNLDNINIKIEFETTVNLDGENNALLIGLVSSDGTPLTDARFIASAAKEGTILDDSTVVIYEDYVPLVIGKKSISALGYTYSIETKDFTIKNSSKNISKLVIIGGKGEEIKADIKISEVKYSIKFGNEDAVLYSYNEQITAPSITNVYDINGHTIVNGFETSDNERFISGTTRATKDMVFKAIGEKKNHTWVNVDEVLATNDKSGVKAHQECSCGAIRLNSSSTSLIERNELIIPAINHTCSYTINFDWTNAINPGDMPTLKLVCSSCGASKTIDSTYAVIKERAGSKVSPTCDRDGLITYTVDVNYEGVSAKDEKTYILNKTTHNLEYIEEVPSTCTIAGTKEHYHCTICLNNYSDETASSLLEDVSLPTSHHLLKVNATDPSCERDGNIEYYLCSDCNKNFDSEGRLIASVVVRATGHQYNENFKCINCGKTKPNSNQNKDTGCFSSLSLGLLTPVLGLCSIFFIRKKKEIK